MRQIKSQEEIEKKAKRNRLIVGVILIALMLFSSLGYAFFSSGGTSSSEEQAPVNGEYVNGRWTYTISDQVFGFLNYIDLARKTPVEIEKNIKDYAGQEVYIDTNNNPLVFEEVGLNLGRYASRFQEACFQECEENLPEKDCSSNLIVYRESSENRVYQQEECVFIEGDLVAVDAFLYKILEFF